MMSGILLWFLATFFLTGLAIIITIAFQPGGFTRSPVGKEVFQAFLPVNSQYMAMCETANQAGFHTDEKQILDEFKYFIIDMEKGFLDNEFHILKKEYRANTPDEVTTLVCVKRENKYLFSYVSGAAAYQPKWIAYFINMKTGKTFDSRVISGGKPAEIKVWGGDQIGKEPNGKIAERCEFYAEQWDR